MASNYSCLLLDIDGTLLDFDAAERQAIAGTLEFFELPCDETTISLFSSINAGLWQALERGEIRKEKLATQRFAKLLQALETKRDPVKINNEYMTRLSEMAMPYPGVEDFLRELAEFSTLAVVSNGNYRIQMSRLKKSGLLPYFDEVFVSEKLGCTKPNPRFFDLALRKLGVKKKQRVLVVGDSLTADIKGGNSAKLDTCWCNFTNMVNETNIQPTYTVRSYEELKLVAVGEEELKIAALREKRHTEYTV